MDKSMMFAGRVVQGVPFFFERTYDGRIALPAIQLLERENTMLRMALAESENGGTDNDSQEAQNATSDGISPFLNPIPIIKMTPRVEEALVILEEIFKSHACDISADMDTCCADAVGEVECLLNAAIQYDQGIY